MKFDDGLLPGKSFRAERIVEIDKELEVLNLKLKSLSKSINELVIEKDIYSKLDLLEDYIDGKINLQVVEPKNV